VTGPLAGRPAGAGREHGGGDAAAAVVGAGGHAEHSGPASFDHQHPHAKHLVVVGRGEETGPRGDPGKDQLAGRFGVRAILHLCPGGEPSRAGGEADRHGQGRGRWSNGEQAVDRSGRHHRRSLTVVAARGELVIEPAMQLRRTDLDERCLVAAGVEPLGDLECLCPPSGSGRGRRRRREGRVGTAAGDGRGVAQQPPVGDLDGCGRPGVRGEPLDQQHRVRDHAAPRGGQGLAERPVHLRRDCQEVMARVAAAPWRGMGMPPEMTAGTQREAVTARPRRVRSRTPLWAVGPPPE